MDQLMQFISASLTDMTRGDRLLTNNNNAAGSSTTSKPYKCALLDERTSSSSSSSHTPPSSDASASAAAAAAAAGEALVAAAMASRGGPLPHGHHVCVKHEESNKDIVQQSQVSSTRSPSVLANDIIGPLLLEALDGFLFMVDNMGKIQFISENVTQYLKYTKDDLIGNKIYNLVHGEDYSHFTKSLELLSKESTSKSRTFSCRMNVKPPGEERDPCYDNMQITAILQPHPGDADSDKSSRCLLACIARRVGCVEKSTTSLGIEKFTTKQDLKGKILACDTSGGQKTGSRSYSKLIGENVQDFCHGNDRPQLLKHHREVIMNGSNTSGVYRFRLHENRFVFVQTKSKLFKNPMNGNPEFIMSTHSIVRECDTESELKGSASSCLMKAIIGNSGSKLGKDRLDLTSKSRQAAVSTQPQSTMFDLEDLFSDPHLDFGNIADDSSFCDIPDLLPNSTQWTSLSDLSLDKGLSSCPASPMGSIPTLSPATSASRSPRMGSSAVPQGWIPKECRPPKQGRGRPRSSKKATVFERAQSWMPPCSSTMGGGTMGGGMTMGQGTFSVPVVTTQQESKRNLVHPRSVGSYSAVGPSLTDSWENLYSPPTSADHFSSHAASSSSKKLGFPEVNLLQQMRQLQQVTRQRSISGSSTTSTSWVEKLTPSVRGGNKDAHLLDLLMCDDDEEDDTSTCLSSPSVHREGQSTKTAASIKSELSDSEMVGSCGHPRRQAAATHENEDETPKVAPGKKPAMQNVILKHLLSQVDEDSQPFKCDLKLVPAESGASQMDITSQVDDAADSSAAQSAAPPTDVANSNVSNEAEPKKKDDVLLKQLLNKDEERFAPSRSASPELLKSLLSSDDTSAQPAEAHSSETEVASSGLSSPVAMEMSFPYHLTEFLSGGVKRKASEVDDTACHPAPFKLPARSTSLTEHGPRRGSKRKSGGSMTGPSKQNILLAQLLSKEVDNDPMVSVKNPSAIATVTPLMQMLQQSCGKSEESTMQNNRDWQNPGSAATFGSGETDLADDLGGTEVQHITKVRPLSLPGDVASGDGRSQDTMALDKESGCLALKDWADYDISDLSPAADKCDDSTMKEFIEKTNAEEEEEAVQEMVQQQQQQQQQPQQQGPSAPAPEDPDRTDVGSPSEEDKKILAELEEVLESSRFTMEDLNSMLGISSGLSLELPAKNATKSAINALEEQVSRIDSDLKLQAGVEDRDGPDRGRQMHGGHGWPIGNEMTDLGMLGDFDELITPSVGQRCSQMMQGSGPKRITETFNMFDPMNRPSLATSLASLPAYQRQSSLQQQQQQQQQQLFTQGQLQVNQGQLQVNQGQLQVNQGQLQVNKPVLPSATSAEQGVESVNGSREEIFGDYTPISPALQDDVFSPGDSYGYPQMANPDLHPRSSMSYPGTPMSSLYSLGSSQACSPKHGMMTPSTRCHSTQMNQFGSYFGGNLPVQSGMRETGDKKRSRFIERMNQSLNHPALNAMLAETGNGDLGMLANQRNYELMNQAGWNQMHAGQADGNLMVDQHQRTVAQFNQARLNMMSGSQVNEPSKGGSSFYGSNLNSVRQMFKGSVNQMNAGEPMNQMNLANQMSQMSSVGQMSMNQMNQMNIGQMNQINVRQMNQINVGQINQINVGQINQINVGQMSPMGMGGSGGNQISMGQMNLGQMNMNLGQMNAMNMGQMSHFDRTKRGSAFNQKSAAPSPEEFSHPVKMVKTSLGSQDPAAGMMDRMSRSKGHRGGHMEFLPGNQPQAMDAAMIRPQQRMSAAGMMNTSEIGMNFESIGLGMDSSHLGHGEAGVMGQVPHPGLGRMTHHSGMGAMSHHSLGHMSQMGSGGGQMGKAASMNGVGGHHRHPQAVGHPGGQTVGLLHRTNLQTKPTSSTGFMRQSLDLPGFGQGTMGQQPQLGQSPMGQSQMGQSQMGQSPMGQSQMGQSQMGQSQMGQSPMGQSQMGQSHMGQSPMGQSQMSQSTFERVSHPGRHNLNSSDFESPPKRSMEEIYQGTRGSIYDLDQFAGGSMGGQPSAFGDGIQGSSYRMGGSDQRHTLQGQSNVFAPEQQRHLSAQPTQDPLLLSPISNHSVVSLDGSGSNKNQMSNVCTVNNAGRQAISRDASKTVQRSLSEMSGLKETSSTREYIKQELRNMCTARAQQGHHSLHHQQMHHQHQQQQQQQHLQHHQHQQQPMSAASSRLGPVPGFDDEIPLEILESINEITKAQEIQQKLMTQNANQATSFEAARPQSKNRDPLLYTGGENSHDPLGSNPFWDPLEGDGLVDQIQNPVLLSFDGIFEPQLDSSPRILPKMTNKSGSLLQKLLSDTT